MKFRILLLVSLIIHLLTACSQNTHPLNELNVDEIKGFIRNDDSGFLYIKSALDSHNESDEQQLREIERIAQEESVSVSVFDQGNYNGDLSDLGITQYTRTIAYYQNGEVVKDLDFMNLSEDQITSEIRNFIQDTKFEFMD